MKLIFTIGYRLVFIVMVTVPGGPTYSEVNYLKNRQYLKTITKNIRFKSNTYLSSRAVPTERKTRAYIYERALERAGGHQK